MKIEKIGLTTYDAVMAKCMHKHTITNAAGITTCKDCWHKFNSDRKSYQEIEDAVKTVIDAIETTKLAAGANGSVSSIMVDRMQQISCAIPMIEKLPGIYAASIEAFLNTEQNTTETMLHENKGMES